MQPLDRTFDRQLGAGLGDVFHDAIAAPGAVDTHHVSRDAPLEYDAFAPAPLCRGRHGWIPFPRQFGRTAMCGTSTRLTAGWLTNGKSGNRRRDIGRIPIAEIGEDRVRQRAVEVSPYARLVL